MFKTYVCYIATKLVLIRHMLWGIYTKKWKYKRLQNKVGSLFGEKEKILHFRVVNNGSESSENGLPLIK